MKSIEEKKLAGTYRKDRDGKKTGTFKGSKVVDILPPPSFEDYPAGVKKAFKKTAAELCAVGLVFSQDVPTIYQAFDILAEIAFLDGEIKSLKKIAFKKLTGKSLDEEELKARAICSKAYDKLLSKKLRCVSSYNAIMSSFFVSPKERMRALVYFNEDQNDDKEGGSPVAYLLSK